MDSRTLRSAVLDRLRRSVGFDAYVFLLTDPVTCVGSSPLADVSVALLLPQLPTLIRLKYLSSVNRWTSLESVARLSSPSASLMWQSLLANYGVTDIASAVFRDRFGCWGWLDLWRVGSSFTSSDLSAIGAVVPEVTSSLRACQAATFDAVGETSPRPGPAVLLLSPSLAVREQTPDTHAYLQALLPPSAIPAGAYNVAAQLLAVEAGVDDHPPSARVHLTDSGWLTLRAARLGDDIAVTIEECQPGDRLDLFARATGLSTRETELLSLLAEGLDTKEVAMRMFLSEHTVQDHLKSVFAKAGTRSRRAILARALGHRRRDGPRNPLLT
ncbi:helix-turn-helix transcriptional regulator [Rhizocola hellebori]|uniref:helix-turn-helix transcriptional regulator n=1 Tax=Rhizocola hellebori TaxID=1392758 RepID=UPI00194219A1|nr:helix-turn-helix transcriptional regulator [Rhizocola hellebori]